MKYILILFFLCFTILSSGQNFSQKDTLVHYSFKELEDKFYRAKPDSLKAVLYANYYIQKAIKEKDTLRQADGYYYLSDVSKDSSYFINFCDTIIKKTKNIKNRLYPAILHIQKGDFYYQKDEKDIALNNYLLAKTTFGKNRNDSLQAILYSRLGMLKFRNRQFKESLKLLKNAYNYYNVKNINSMNVNEYCSILVNLTSTFNSLKNYDSAFFYNKKANLIASKFNKKNILGYTTNIYGTILLKKENYINAIDSLKKSLPYIIDDKNYIILSTSYLEIGKSYSKINDKKNALKFYLKIDSLFLWTQNYYKSQKPAYKFLVSYYKQQNNDTKQLEYINKYIKVDSVLNTRAKDISKNLTKNYDIPNLLAERKIIENRLKNQLSSFEKWIWSIGVFSLIISCFLFFQARKRKQYKKRFLELLDKNQPKITKVISKKRNSKIPKEVVTHILKCLEQFETNHQYISSKMTLSSLAKTFNTNANYLSKVINNYKHQSFTNYMNQLRINYTVEKLKNDKRFRKYSVKAIAGEVGFNNAESFSKAFYKNTGIKPSYFITELEKQ